jgi:uncharacterized protein (TIGR03067 family)
MRWLLMLTTAGLLAGAGDAPKDAAKKDLEAFDGTWTTTTIIYNGKDFLAQSNTPLRFVFKGGEAVIEGSDEVKKEYAKIKVKLDPSAMPKCVDITVTGGGQLNAVIEGIYELKKDEIRLCAKVFGNERPTEFASPAGSSIALVVLKRDNK